jgi:hypothetical protein
MGDANNDREADNDQTAFLFNEFCARLSDVRKEAESKGRTKAEVDEIILWLTGHTAKSLQKAMDAEIDIETFYAKAPRFQPTASLIKGVVCGVRVEEIKDETMRKARYLDKLIDELAKAKRMEKILRK